MEGERLYASTSVSKQGECAGRWGGRDRGRECMNDIGRREGEMNKDGKGRGGEAKVE